MGLKWGFFEVNLPSSVAIQLSTILSDEVKLKFTLICYNGITTADFCLEVNVISCSKMFSIRDIVFIMYNARKLVGCCDTLDKT